MTSIARASTRPSRSLLAGAEQALCSPRPPRSLLSRSRHRQAGSGRRRPERGDRREPRAHRRRFRSLFRPSAAAMATPPSSARTSRQVVTNDLARSGLFRPIAQQAYIQAASSPGRGARTSRTGRRSARRRWSPAGLRHRAAGRSASSSACGTCCRRPRFRALPTPPAQANWRRIAHIMADVIYERLLGEKGYFDTRIVYIGATGPRGRQTKRLAIMDQDSENNRFLTDGSWLVLTPRFHPTRDEIAFMSYANNRPRVYLFDLGSGQQSVLGEFPGMTFAPRFSPDGNSVIMSLATRPGLGHRQRSISAASAARRLTNSGVDRCQSRATARTAVQIVFNSDRGGDQQLYVMGAGGGGAKRISFGSGRYATPVWSPRGDLIAFTRFGGDESATSRSGSCTRMAPASAFCPRDSRSKARPLPKRPCADVLASELGARQPGIGVLVPSGLGRYHRLQRTGGQHADRRLGPGVVAAGGIGNHAQVHWLYRSRQGSRELDPIRHNRLIASSGGTDYRSAGLACLPLMSPSTRDVVA